MFSDGLDCFQAATSAGAVHDREITGGGKASVLNEEFKAVNTLIGSVETALTGTYRYLAEVHVHFNRRCDLRAILCGLPMALVRAPRRTECGIRVAEVHRRSGHPYPDPFSRDEVEAIVDHMARKYPAAIANFVGFKSFTA